jgi:hypothetical protein
VKRDWAVKACLLGPDPLGDPARVRAAAGAMAEKTPPSGASLDYHTTLALAHYRAGRPVPDGLGPRRAVNPGKWSLAAWYALQALDHHRAGRASDARAALDRARADLAEKGPDPTRGRPYPVNWQDWVTAEVLVREAEAALVAAPRPTNGPK